MIRFAGVVAGFSLSAAVFAGVETVRIECDFAGEAPGVNLPWTATSVLDAGMAFSGWSAGPGVYGVDNDIDDALGFYVESGATQSPLAEAVGDGEYLTATITPAAALDLNGAKVEFTIERRSWHAPRRYALFTSVGGFDAGDEVFVTDPINSGDYGERTFAAFLPETGYGAVDGPLEFRLCAFEATYAYHDSSLTGFRITTGVQTYTLAVGAGPGGSAAASPARLVFEAGETVQLRATPDANMRFAGWSGDAVGFGNPRTIVMDADTVVTATFEDSPGGAMEMGMNLGGVVDWASDWIFANMFKRARTWISRAVDGSTGWDGGYGWAVPSDADGWPMQVPFDPGDGSPMQWVHTTIILPNGPGDYLLTWEGSGDFRFSTDNSPWVQFGQGQNSHAFSITSDDEALWFEIRSTQAPDHIRNISIVKQEHLPDPPTFEPLYLDRLRDFGTLRFMDWAHTNASPSQSWSNRTTATTYTQTRGEGAAIEHMIELANTLGQNAWFCVPHAADDAYVRSMARLIRDTLDPSLVVYVEYSNETWNSAGPFSQTIYVQDQGEALGLSSNRWQAGQRFVALRSVQIFEMFEEEFGAASDRLQFVMATQSANINVTNDRVNALNDPSINPNYTWPDALAIAPYFGVNFGPSDLPPNAPAYPTIDHLVDVIAPQQIAQVAQQVAAQKQAADAQGWDLICYEAGQHFVGIFGAENDTQLTQILHDANRDPRMYDRYVEYHDMLRDGGVTMCAEFSFCSQWSKWGSWGLLERLNQPLDAAPKYRSTIDWTRRETCPGDSTSDATVDFADLNLLLANWGASASGHLAGDVNLDGAVNFADLNLLLAFWGAACAP